MWARISSFCIHKRAKTCKYQSKSKLVGTSSITINNKAVSIALFMIIQYSNKRYHYVSKHEIILSSIGRFDLELKTCSSKLI